MKKEIFWIGSTTNRAEAKRVTKALKNYFANMTHFGLNTVEFSVRVQSFYSLGVTDIIIETDTEFFDTPDDVWEREIKPLYRIIEYIKKETHVR